MIFSPRTNIFASISHTYRASQNREKSNFYSMKLPKYIDLAIIGAGIQALTLTTHLLQKSAKHYRKIPSFRSESDLDESMATTI